MTCFSLFLTSCICAINVKFSYIIWFLETSDMMIKVLKKVHQPVIHLQVTQAKNKLKNIQADPIRLPFLRNIFFCSGESETEFWSKSFSIMIHSGFALNVDLSKFSFFSDGVRILLPFLSTFISNVCVCLLFNTIPSSHGRFTPTVKLLNRLIVDLFFR